MRRLTRMISRAGRVFRRCLPIAGRTSYMYIFKNAMKCIGRAKGRNVLIGIIVFVIAVSACVGLSIRQAAESAKTEQLSGMSVTATISYDRTNMMNNLAGSGRGEQGGKPSFDRDQFASMMGDGNSLSIDEYKKYAEAESVADFFYSLTSSLDGSENFEPVSTETDDEDEESTDESESGENSSGGMPEMGGMPQMGGMFGGKGFESSGDFSIVGYSSETAMSDFVNGTARITDGEIFSEATDESVCIISEELALFNGISVGDTITLTNPNSEEETYTLTVVGIYFDSSANTDNGFSMFGSTNSDPANKIYMSYNTLRGILDNSESIATTETDETTGIEKSTALRGSLSATYSFADPDAYCRFEEEVRELGLSEDYTVSSTDLQSFENGLTPLKTLSETAGTFLIVILAIGAVILIVLNIFNVRERKYEIGVLTAMGMKKRKVAMQFLAEIFVVTMIAVVIGASIGAVSSVPVTNMLLENQIESQQTKSDNVEANFGRGEIPDNAGGMGGGMPNGGGMFGGDFGEKFQEFMGVNPEASYITEISSATNLTVIWQMLLIAVGLTLVAGSVSMLFVMRYEPLKILANRD